MTPRPSITARDIALIRHRLGLSHEAFALKLGVGWRSVFRWEAGDATPSNMALEKLLTLRDKMKKRGIL